MSRRDRGHLGAFSRWAPFVLVLAILGAGVAADRYALGERWFGWGVLEKPLKPAGPAAVPPPSGLVLPAVAVPGPVADESALSPIAKGKVRRALAPWLHDPALGKHVVAAVAPLQGGPAVFTYGDGAGLPASITKLLTSIAALEVMGADHRFSTKVVREGRRIILVGGGDPYLMSRPDPELDYPERADLVGLAKDTALALRSKGRFTLEYDDSLFSGPDASSGWESDYLPDGVVAPIRALWADQGRPAEGFGRVDDPSRAAADYFANALRSKGVKLTGEPKQGVAAPAAALVAEAHSAPLSQIVERVIDVSDNEAAEVLAHHVGLATGRKGSFRAGVVGVEETLTALGIPIEGDVLLDGSGLSRHNRLTTATLLGVLQKAAGDPDLAPVLTGLPVAGFTGSLEYRFVDVPAKDRGRVRAKTGTLTGVSTLAGIAVGPDGSEMAFVLIADQVAIEDTLKAREALDNAAAALGACACG